MSQANVYTSGVSNSVWYTDKVEIVTGNAVTYNVYVMNSGNPVVGLVGSVQPLSNVMLTTGAAQNLVGATITTGTGVANTVTVVSAVNGQSLNLSANATVGGTYNYTLTKANPGTMYTNAPQVAANSRQQIYVGAGNKLTITGSGYTAREIGTASSAVAGD